MAVFGKKGGDKTEDSSSGGGTDEKKGDSGRAKKKTQESGVDKKDAGPTKWGNPPNLSKDPAGYNTKLFPNFVFVRTHLSTTGYTNENTYSAKAAKNIDGEGLVLKFQRDYNRVAKAVAASKVPHAQWSGMKTMGQLKTDDDWGPNTARALEIAMGFPGMAGMAWLTALAKAKAAGF